jgi:hypothetical protein
MQLPVTKISALELIAELQKELAQSNEELAKAYEECDELTNDNSWLKEENQKLKDEIAVLKKLTPRPVIAPSKLEKGKGSNKAKDNTNPPTRGKHPRQKKKTFLTIHQEQIIHPLAIPEGAKFKGYKKYDVQDIIFQSNNTRFQLARWQLSDGTYISGKLPMGVHGHYGPELITYILDEYYSSRVPEGVLFEKLQQRGILISEGQLNNILIENKDVLHQEKKELLHAGIEAHNQLQTDDTGARHKGKNQYTNVIGNEWFSVFTTTNSKSRVNFLKLLQGSKDEYWINEDTVAYLEKAGAPGYLPGYISFSKGDRFATEENWLEFLTSRNITKEAEVRLVTEAALFASLFKNGIPRDLNIHADDAGQFEIFFFYLSLCWIHEERHYRKIIPTTEQSRKDLDDVRNKIWEIYRDLKGYQENPSEFSKKVIEKQFDDLFLNLTTSSHTLNHRLRLTYEKKHRLLRVLDKPNTPLHNNSSESDARAAVIKRKISGGTRSDAGRDCRDTFLSLKQTCRKLGINFIIFLRDRVCGLYEIPRLAEVIRQRSSTSEVP